MFHLFIFLKEQGSMPFDIQEVNMLSSKFSSILKTDAEAVIISSEVNRFYFTRFAASDGFLVITKNDSVFFTDSRYIEAAENSVTVCRCELFNSMKDTLVPFLQKAGVKTIYTESDNLTVSMYESYKKFFENCEVIALPEVEAIIGANRSVKNDYEVGEIVKAQRIAEKAFEHILSYIKPGVTDKDIALELEYFMLKNGADGLSFETIAVSGKNSSMPHGVPTLKKVEDGDFVTMDYGALVNGYHSDMTRTVAVGRVSDEQKKVYDTVLKAQLASINALKPGILGVDADKAARDVIASAGYGEYFGHGTGHGVGVEIHELPNLSPRSPATLEVGNIVTIEPGIYLPGKFGVRIEDMALITPDGKRVLTEAPKELIVL